MYLYNLLECIVYLVVVDLLNKVKVLLHIVSAIETNL